MANYSSECDSSGEIQSIEFHGHEGNAPNVPHKDLNFPIPSGLTLTWKNGNCRKIIKIDILGTGAGRVVLGGIDVSSNTWSSYVFKLQGWSWYHWSNEEVRTTFLVL